MDWAVECSTSTSGLYGELMRNGSGESSRCMVPICDLYM